MPRLFRHGAVAAIALLVTIAIISVAAGSPFDEPTSECGESVVVFAKNVSSDSRAAFVDLPAGVYETRLIARGSVVLESIDRYRKNAPRVSMFGWNGVDPATLADREVISGNTIFSGGLVSTPGGVSQASVTFVYSGYGEWAKSSQWRWEIIRPGVCAAPVQSEDE